MRFTLFLGLYVETKHLDHFQRFRIKHLIPQNAETKQILIDEMKVTVAQYYRNKYNIILRFVFYLFIFIIVAIHFSQPFVPLVVARGKDNTLSYFPMELCYVVDNQRLKTNQQTSNQVQEMIKVIICFFILFTNKFIEVRHCSS